MRVHRIPGRRRARGMTVLEVLIAVTVLSVLFILAMGIFKDTTRTASLDTWRTNAKQRIAQVGARFREDFDKASYPCKVFPGATVIYDGAAEPPDENTADKDPGDKYYVRYFEGVTSGDARENRKILEWRVCVPKYDKGVEKFLSQGTIDKAAAQVGEVTCTLSTAVTPDNIPILVYERTSSRGSERFEVARGVEEVRVEGKEVKPPGYQDYETATYKGTGEKKYAPWDDDGVINLTIRLNAKYVYGDKYGVVDAKALGKTTADMAILEEKITLKSQVRIKAF